MKLTILLIFLGLAHVSASLNAQISITNNKISHEDVFRSIKDQSGYDFFYNADLFKNLKPIAINLKNAPLKDVLETTLNGLNLRYKIVGKTIVITPNPKLEPTESIITSRLRVEGIVKDENGNPMSSVTVIIKGSNRSTSTDKSGYFLLLDAKNEDVLIFKYLGYATKEVKVSAGQMTITMSPLAKDLNEIVVSTGYQTIENKYLTGAVTSIKVDSIKVPGINTLDKLLEGRVPGLTFLQNSSQAGATPRLRIRGTSTILGNQEPIWVLDGIVLRDPVNVSAAKVNDLDFVNLIGNAISGINPDDIEQIDILKDAASTAIYGARAANGVIVITTKKGKIGPPQFSFNTTVTKARRPRYTDQSIYLMDSKQRIDVSREMFERGIVYGNQTTFSGYEKAYQDYQNGVIGFADFKSLTNYYETLNTDWFDVVATDALSTANTLSFSGGNLNTKYYASLGYVNEQSTIKDEFSKRYTSAININTDYKNFSMQFGLNANVSKRQYNPSDVGVLNYAYSTSRAIPAYLADGSYAYYPVSTGSQKIYG